MPAINDLLIANRGEIAVRVMRTATEMGIRTIAIYSDPDADARHVKAADRAVRLPGSNPTETYLNAGLIIEAALRTGARAIHPGYGFLSENAAFAEACADAGIIFVGPTPRTIELMGSKVSAKLLMADAGVPVLPGFTVPAALPADELRAAAEAVGFPLLVKADAGGGGRGMRLVRDPAMLRSEVDAARREAAASFGDDTVFLERYVENPRHVEVQVFGDAHGTITHLHERECSIQRRHQKVIEESPSPGIDDDARTRMTAAAVSAARALDYLGAGTVEFVVSETGDFYFLEVNTRLQVEHPVTEAVTGLDLVRLQLEVAAAMPCRPA